MLVVDITGNTVTVKRAWDGTILATHATTTHLYASRALSVARGQLGTTAATHTLGAAAVVSRVPSPVRDLAVGEATNRIQQEAGGYSNPQGEGQAAVRGLGSGLTDLWDEAVTGYGRKTRIRVI